MENNADKELRDKLGKMSFPFEPQSWQKMETMLDEEDRRRGFAWWWFGGAAILLLLGFGIYEFNTNVKFVTQANVTADAKTIMSRPEISNNELQSGNEYKNDKRKENAVNTIAKSAGKEIVAVNSKPLKSALSQAVNAPGKINKRKGRAKVKAGNNNSVADKAKEMQSGEIKNDKAITGTATQSEETKAVPLVSGNAILSILIDAVGIDKLNTAESGLDFTVAKTGEEPFSFKSIRKKIFNYSIGVAGNITGTTLGAQTGPGSPELFYNKPSFMAGLSHEFLFIKRVALTNSIMYSETSFEVYSPKPAGIVENATNYVCNISEIAIPVGIKFYAISKEKFRVYIHTGFINHIRMKEDFTYIYNVTATTPQSPATPPTQNVYSPRQVSFSNNFSTASSAIAYNSANSSAESVSDLSINSGRRYYASFYSSAGAEYIMKKHLVFFAEPLFYTSLEQVGVQDKRKYNLGLSAGFRYKL